MRATPARENRAVMAGFARVMDESPYSDGATADLILNWFSDDRGYLRAGLPLMPVIPSEWQNPAAQPAAFGDVLAMAYLLKDGEVPEYLFATSTGFFRYAPWNRFGGGANAGLEEVYHWTRGNSTSSVVPQGSQKYPAQITVVGNRAYLSFCDGGGLWVYDAADVVMRPFGFDLQPSPPNAEGPSPKSGGDVNGGGFSVRGRVGATEPDWTGLDGANVVAIGGIDTMRRRYGVVWEGPDGNYSQTSEMGGQVAMQRNLADPANGPEVLRRRFRVLDIPAGPDHAVAAIILATANLDRLPVGDDGSLRFLTRLPSTIAPEHIDDAPDGELGEVWVDRATPPKGVFFVANAFGSTWLLRSSAFPARVWWSEQTSIYGATLEGFLRGHWRDVFPSTGPITGWFLARVPDASENMLVVLKSGAAHFLTGRFPSWDEGTLHNRAGCDGPALIQVCPDGSVVWFGAGTFWRYDPGNGQVADIGSAIRKRLRRVSLGAAAAGFSYRVVSRGEVVFWLPADGDRLPRMGFVWDYLGGGWRLVSHFTDARCALSVDATDETFVAASHNGLTTVWAEGRGYPGFATANITATYRSGWVTPEVGTPKASQPYYAGRLMVAGEEAAENAMALSVYRNWSLDDKATDGLTIKARHPDEDALATYGTAQFGSSLYRTPRHYYHEAAVDAPNATAVAVELSGTGRFTLFSMDTFSSRTFSPFGTNPGGSG
jgi:hypothetical protein